MSLFLKTPFQVFKSESPGKREAVFQDVFLLRGLLKQDRVPVNVSVLPNHLCPFAVSGG